MRDGHPGARAKTGDRTTSAELVIDMHVHYYTETYLRAVQEAPTTETYRRDDGRIVALWRGGVALTVPQPHPGVTERLEMMDELGIGMQVLSVPSPSAQFLRPREAEKLARTVNEELADIVRGHPDRFRALGMVVMQDVDLGLAGIDDCLTGLDMAGIMLLTNIDGMPLDAAAFDPFWEAADDRSMLIYVHPTVPDARHLSDYALAIGVGFFADTNLALARLAYAGVFERFPRIRWVFSHLGGTLPFMLPRLDNYYRQFPECRERAPALPSKYIERLVFDTASTHRPALRCAVDTFGLDRLVFGTDYPHVPGGAGPYMEALEVTGAVGDERAQLLGGRAARLLEGSPV
jgi:predicted TIM-barrel fold metal-dependent hydrolase